MDVIFLKMISFTCMRDKILELLKDKDYSISELNVLLSLDSKGFITLNKTVNGLIDKKIVVFDEKENKLRLNKFLEGSVRYIDGKAYIIDGRQEYLIVNNDEFTLFEDDDILYELNKNTCKCIEIIRRAKVYVTGIIRQGKKDFYFYSDDKLFKDFKVINFKEFKLKRNYKVRCYISDYQNKFLKIDKVIGHVNDIDTLIESVLLKYDVNKDFNNRVKKDLEKIDSTISLQKRKDLRDKNFITIDGVDAKDFDDAICVETNDEGYKLYVAIADVSYYVKEDSPLDIEARKRGTSIYYPGKVIPMLPELLSNDLCSLKEGVDRYTLTVEMNIDYEANVSSYDIYESLICSKHRMTYPDVNKILEHDEYLLNKYSDIKQMIYDAYNLSRIIDKKRKQAGGINFDSNEAIIELRNNKVVDIKCRIQGKSELMIEDFMIEANKVVASHMYYLDLPMIYRNHDYPKQDKIAAFVKLMEELNYHFKGNIYELESFALNNCLKSFEGSVEYPLVSSMLLRCMSKAVYETSCAGHYGLGLKEYCHFTSPIRRYPDLIVHRMLKKYVFNYSEEINEDVIINTDICKNSNCSEKKATLIERSISDIYKCEFMQDKIGEVFEGVVSYVGEHGFFVKLENTIEGFVGYESPVDYKIGQKVKIILSSVDRVSAKIDFVLYKKKYDRTYKEFY